MDLIYIQAKRFANGNKVTRHDLQAFIGAMEHINKGVFITTSSLKASQPQDVQRTLGNCLGQNQILVVVYFVNAPAAQL